MVSCGATWMKPETVMLNEVSQSRKDKCHMISFVCRTKKKNVIQMNIFAKLKTDSQT